MATDMDMDTDTNMNTIRAAITTNTTNRPDSKANKSSDFILVLLSTTSTDPHPKLNTERPNPNRRLTDPRLNTDRQRASTNHRRISTRQLKLRTNQRLNTARLKPNMAPQKETIKLHLTLLQPIHHQLLQPIHHQPLQPILLQPLQPILLQQLPPMPLQQPRPTLLHPLLPILRKMITLPRSEFQNHLTSLVTSPTSRLHRRYAYHFNQVNLTT